MLIAVLIANSRQLLHLVPALVICRNRYKERYLLCLFFVIATICFLSQLGLAGKSFGDLSGFLATS